MNQEYCVLTLLCVNTQGIISSKYNIGLCLLALNLLYNTAIKNNYES